MIAVYDNFFSKTIFNAVYERAKSLPLHTAEDHKVRYGYGNWPGHRSFKLSEADNLFNALAFDTLVRTHPFDERHVLYGDWFIHLRGADSKDTDWIHKDMELFSVLVYLSPTNLTSGTKFYFSDTEPNKDHDTVFVKCVQNRAVVFSANIPHLSYNNYGKDVNDGRLTLNGFLKYVN